jgi:hypothetical protein
MWVRWKPREVDIFKELVACNFKDEPFPFQTLVFPTAFFLAIYTGNTLENGYHDLLQFIFHSEFQEQSGRLEVTGYRSPLSSQEKQWTMGRNPSSAG